jgi:uncharacterized protein YecT (DUF1311 family)
LPRRPPPGAEGDRNIYLTGPFRVGGGAPPGGNETVLVVDDNSEVQFATDSPLEGSGFEPLVPRPCKPIRSQPCVITTLPKCPRPSKWRYASFALANGNARSITGRKWCIAIARFMASKSTRLPTLIEPSVIPRPVSNKGSRPAPDFERLAPIRLRCPPTANAFSDIPTTRAFSGSRFTMAKIAAATMKVPIKAAAARFIERLALLARPDYRHLPPCACEVAPILDPARPQTASEHHEELKVALDRGKVAMSASVCPQAPLDTSLVIMTRFPTKGRGEAMQRVLPLCAFLAALASGPGAALADELDEWCAQAKKAPSIVICSDAELRQQAIARNKLFEAARAKLPPEAYKALTDDQARWIKSYTARCGVSLDGPLPSLPLPQSVINCYRRESHARTVELAERLSEPSAAAIPPPATSDTHREVEKLLGEIVGPREAAAMTAWNDCIEHAADTFADQPESARTVAEAALGACTAEEAKYMVTAGIRYVDSLREAAMPDLMARVMAIRAARAKLRQESPGISPANNYNRM